MFSDNEAPAHLAQSGSERSAARQQQTKRRMLDVLFRIRVFGQEAAGNAFVKLQGVFAGVIMLADVSVAVACVRVQPRNIVVLGILLAPQLAVKQLRHATPFPLSSRIGAETSLLVLLVPRRACLFFQLVNCAVYRCQKAASAILGRLVAAACH